MIVKDQIKKRELDPEQKKEIRDLRNHAVRDAWKQEKELLLQGRGHRQWNQRQQREILERGSVRGYQGHHMISVQIPQNRRAIRIIYSFLHGKSICRLMEEIIFSQQMVIMIRKQERCMFLVMAYRISRHRLHLQLFRQC